MKRPWMPFYVADYLADTAHLSTTEHGAYVLLILHYWTKGGLPTDEESIRRITRLTPRQWSQSRDVLRSLFQDGWRHKRVDAELAQSIEKSKVNSANAKRRHNGRTEAAEVSQVRSDTQSQSQSQSESQKKDSSPLPPACGGLPGRTAKPMPFPENVRLTDRERKIAIAEQMPEADIPGQFRRFCLKHRTRRSKDFENDWRLHCHDEKFYGDKRQTERTARILQPKATTGPESVRAQHYPSDHWSEDGTHFYGIPEEVTYIDDCGYTQRAKNPAFIRGVTPPPAYSREDWEAALRERAGT